MKRSILMCLLVGYVAVACGPDKPGNMEEAGATADAKLATAGPAMATTRSQA